MTYDLARPAGGKEAWTILRWAGGIEAVAAELDRITDIELVKEIVDRAAALEQFNRAQRASHDVRHRASAVLIIAKHKLAEAIKEMPKAEGSRNRGGSGGTVAVPPTLERLGIGKGEASRYRKLAKLSRAQLAEYIADVQRRSERITATGAIASVSHAERYKSDEWYTPRQYVDAARDVLGGIDLDIASCAKAQETVRAKKYFSETESALADQNAKWPGRVWFQPPFSLTVRFVDRLVENLERGTTRAAIALLNADTGTKWFHELAARGPLCLTKGRLAFEDPRGRAVSGNRIAQVFFGLGEDLDAERFAQVFGSIGTVFGRYQGPAGPDLRRAGKANRG